MKLFVGQSALRGDFSRYRRRLDLLELPADPARLPKLKRVGQLREEAGAEFVFSVVIPTTAFTGATLAHDRVELAKKLCSLAQAKFLVIATPADFRPSAAAQAKLAALFDPFRDSAPHLFWEPSGLWEPERARATCCALGVGLVEDPRFAEVSEISYLRIRQLGVAAQVNETNLELLAEKLLQSQEAHVVVNGSGAALVRKGLSRIFGELQELDAEFEEDEEEEVPSLPDSAPSGEDGNEELA